MSTPEAANQQAITSDSIALESRDEKNRGLRVEFYRVGSRYGHRLLAVGFGDEPKLLLEAGEGDTQEKWPVSPPFQELHTTEELPVMLVGMAGNSHWSASVAPSEEPGIGPTIVFDIACRCKQEPQYLGSQYQLASGVSVVENQLVFENRSDCRLELLALEPTSCVTLNSNSLEITPTCLGDEKIPKTIRWRYAVRIKC